MYSPHLQVEHRTHARTTFAMVALLMVGLAGCASDPTSLPNRPPADEGVFTGEFVDGKPVYRFPTIMVVGWRSSIWSAPDPEVRSHDN